MSIPMLAKFRNRKDFAESVAYEVLEHNTYLKDIASANNITPSNLSKIVWKNLDPMLIFSGTGFTLSGELRFALRQHSLEALETYREYQESMAEAQATYLSGLGIPYIR